MGARLGKPPACVPRCACSLSMSLPLLGAFSASCACSLASPSSSLVIGTSLMEAGVDSALSRRGRGAQPAAGCQQKVERLSQAR